MHIRFVGYALDSTGYGQFARLILAALHGAGHEIELSLLSDRTEDPARFGESGKLVSHLLSRTGTRPTVNVVASPPNAFERGRHPRLPNIGLTMCERFLVPENWVYACNRMDGLLVPSAHSRLAFASSGVTAPIEIVPPGARPCPPALPTGDRPYTFLSVFDWAHPHKDPRRLLEAYWRAFPNDESVLLRVKTFARGPNGEAEVLADVRRWKKALGLDKTPKVELVLGSWTEEERDRQYLERTDAYVSSHHSEGWGLPIWEAMRVGLPAIATDYGGNRDFMDADTALPVGYVLHVGEWADVDVGHLALCMRWCFEHPDEARELGQAGRRRVLTDFTPPATAMAFATGIESILGGRVRETA